MRTNLKSITLMIVISFQFIAISLKAQDTTKTDNSGIDISKPVAILEPLDSSKVKQMESLLVNNTTGIGKPYSDRAEWKRIAASFKSKEFIETVSKLKIEDFPKWSDDIYLEYKLKGVRNNADKMTRSRQQWLGQFVIAECIENKGRFMPIINQVVKELLHQPSWTLSAHDKDYQNFYGKQYDVDLNSSVMATIFSQTYYLLGDKLSEDLRRDIRECVQKRVFNPVMETFKTLKDTYWLTTTNNWNAVCLSGITGAALAILPNKHERAIFVTIAEKYCQNYLASYTDDGYCTEGLGYYNYGFGKFICLREFLLAATNNQLDLFNNEKMGRIAKYPINMEIINQCYPTISDCVMGVKPRTDIIWYCNNALGLGLKKYNALSTPNPNDPVYDMIKLVNQVHQTAVNEKNEKNETQIRSYFENTGVLICRPNDGSAKGAIGVAIKGGTNNEHHNHNALGSYTIVQGKEVMMGDPGGAYFYNDKSFSSERYTFFKIYASFGHPVPLVATVQQKEGESSQAKVLKTDFTKQQDLLTMDIASAYRVPTLQKLERSFLYKRTDVGSLEVADNYRFSTPQLFETALTTRAKWKQINDTQLLFELGGEKMLVTIKAPCPFKIISETINENCPPFERIGIQLVNPLKEGSVTISYSSN